MTIQFKNGKILFVAGKIAMDPNCCCGGECAVILGYSYCRLSWCVNASFDITEPFTVEFNTPEGLVVYDDIYCGIFLTPPTGTYTATLIKDAVEIGTCSITIEECTPPYPCCINFSGLNVSIEPEESFYEGYFTSGTYRDYSYTDLSWLDHTSFRVGSMLFPPKTETNCYEQWGVAEDITLSSGYITYYWGIPWTSGDPTCGIPGTNYYYQRIHYTFKVRYFTDTTVRVFGVVTGEDFSIVGTPLGPAPPEPVVGSERTFWQDDFYTCEPLGSLSTSDFGLLSTCDGSRQILLQSWPSFISL